MTTWIAVLYSVGLLTGLGGLALVIIDWRTNGVTARRWKAANPKDNKDGSWAQTLMINEVVTGLIGTTWRRIAAVILLFLGILLDALGNFLGLGQ
jgi:hypothetical protein